MNEGRLIYGDSDVELRLFIEPGEFGQSSTDEMESFVAQSTHRALSIHVPELRLGQYNRIYTQKLREQRGPEQVDLSVGCVFVTVAAETSRHMPMAELERLLYYALAEAAQAVRDAEIEQMTNADFGPVEDPELVSSETEGLTL